MNKYIALLLSLFISLISFAKTAVNAQEVRAQYDAMKAQLASTEVMFETRAALAYSTLKYVRDASKLEASLKEQADKLASLKATVLKYRDYVEQIEAREKSQKSNYPCIKAKDLNPLTAGPKIEELMRKMTQKMRPRSNLKIDQDAVVKISTDFLSNLAGKLFPIMLETNELKKAGLREDFLEEMRLFLGRLLEAMSISCDEFETDEEIFEAIIRIVNERATEL